MSRCFAWRVLNVALFCLLASLLTSQGKPIKLRNEVIPDKLLKSQRNRPFATPEQPLSGLFLVQLSSAPDETVRRQLKGAGVDLLQYVPDDAFVARFHGARLTAVRQLPFVRFVGEYRPDHKIHKALRAASAAAAPKTNSEVRVALLLAPRAPAEEIAAARRSLNGIRQESTLRSGTVLRGTMNPARLDALARSHAVLWIEADRDMLLFDEVASKIVAGDGGPGTLLTQTYGYDGSGVTVAVADSGLNNGEADSMHPDLYGRTPAFFYYGGLGDASDEHGHGTHVAGIVAGNGATGETDDNGALYGLGVAPGANIVGQRLFDGIGNYYAPPSFEKMTRDAYRAGAEIGSNSWGDDTQGRYDLSAMEFDELVRDADALSLGHQEYILEFSAGNAGPATQTIGSPAVAKNVIATGASQNDRIDLFIYDSGPDGMADFSSRGPAEDGRIKPDIVAPGTWIASLQSYSATDEYAWAGISPNYQYQGGTSQAGPHASGAAAVFVQYYRETQGSTPSPALVKAALINCAEDMDDSVETDPIPNMDEGWGRIYLPALIDGSLNYNFVDQSVLLTNEGVFEYRVLAGFGAPLKITLAYTDVPGFPAAVPALVNDLDLAVIGPNGSIYLGNRFQDGESLANASEPDRINNVEQVLIYEPAAGEYLVRVHARNVVEDARDDTPLVEQDFALVISGETPPEGVGTLFLDRRAYRPGSRIRVTLVDSDLVGRSSVSVTARSSSEASGESLMLFPVGSSGSFTGSIAAVTGPPLGDGQLQVAHNDLIEVTYFDASPPAQRTATARADLFPPILTGVGEGMVFGQTYISWTTDEPATSLVRYGITPALGSAVGRSAFTTAHSLSVPDLVAGQLYYFEVVSSDQAGNTSTNNNAGALFTFVARQPNTLLLVDAYTPNSEDPVISLQTYVGPLNDIGVTYDIWSVDNMGRAPGLNDLKPYRVLIWRLNDGIFSSDTLSAADQAAITAYLNLGGAFFLASMEQLTRLGSSPFRSQVLHVTSFEEDVGLPEVAGADNDVVSAGLTLPLEYSQYHTFYHEFFGISDDIADIIEVDPRAVPILFDSLDGSKAGMRFPRSSTEPGGRVVFLPFPLDAVSATDPAPNNRTALLRSILRFLVPGVSSDASISLDSPAYVIPSVATVEVTDADLIGRSSATATAYSDTQSTGIPVPLSPTAVPGLFTGTFDIIPAQEPFASGKLRVTTNDQVRVQFVDASASATVTATAVIDMVPPTIANITVNPDYRTARVSWETSEPTDAVVQFGESSRLGRTASDLILSDFHEVLITGLVPDKTYYFKVTSRDAAGNSTIDDNDGRLYTFRTLEPLIPPWHDDLNSGAGNWTVFDGEESQGTWRLGTPAVEEAHSPPAAWGSNLTGEQIDYAETFLISPAIYLTNGNQATLSFWHNFDIGVESELNIEFGQVLLISDNSTAAAVLAEFGDSTFGWEYQEIDLSPHVGKVVYIVWYYVLLAFDSGPHPGWLVDDVSVDVNSVPTGTIAVTNNLWQSTFILTGPIYRKGRGSALISNAPQGDYLVEFADQLYYQAPPAQTNTLVPGGKITFTGNYTFVDANSNNIPDLWELRFFDNVSTNRTQLTDTDGDGMTDYAEFVAGTDPNSPARAFSLLATTVQTNVLRLEWDTVPAQMYRVLSTTNLSGWAPLTTWIEATTNRSHVLIPMPPGADPTLFRVQAGATNSPPGLSPNLRLRSTVLPSGAVQISWTTTSGRGYRLWLSTNTIDWTPMTPWMQSGSTVLSTNVPASSSNSPQFYRVEVAP